jgi:hypothetical protein
VGTRTFQVGKTICSDLILGREASVQRSAIRDQKRD